MHMQIIYIYNAYTYKEDLAQNNLQDVICHKTITKQTNQTEIESSFL